MSAVIDMDLSRTFVAYSRKREEKKQEAKECKGKKPKEKTNRAKRGASHG